MGVKLPRLLAVRLRMIQSSATAASRGDGSPTTGAAAGHVVRRTYIPWIASGPRMGRNFGLTRIRDSARYESMQPITNPAETAS